MTDGLLAMNRYTGMETRFCDGQIPQVQSHACVDKRSIEMLARPSGPASSPKKDCGTLHHPLINNPSRAKGLNSALTHPVVAGLALRAPEQTAVAQLLAVAKAVFNQALS